MIGGMGRNATTLPPIAAATEGLDAKPAAAGSGKDMFKPEAGRAVSPRSANNELVSTARGTDAWQARLSYDLKVC